MTIRTFGRLALLTAAALPLGAMASSHREAPEIAGMPRVDGTDFYMFRSYEPGRSAYVTLIANYIPLQDSYGGPNYFNLDDNAVYAINVDNNGNADSDLTFEFRFETTNKDFKVTANGVQTPIPLILTGPITASGTTLNVQQSYTVTLVRNGRSEALTNQNTGANRFLRPVDNIGLKSISDYAAYAENFIYNVTIPGCSAPGRVFVGQRKDGFVVNLGEVFDLVNLNPIGPRDGEPNTISDKNVTSLALEVPTTCLTNGKDPVIGGWTTASLLNGGPPGWGPPGGGPGNGDPPGKQVSRLGMPLVNELIIGLPDKDKFNASRPNGDGQFLHYVTNPYVPVLLNAEFGSAALIPDSPRNDLVAIFLTGVKVGTTNINQPLKVTPSEMLRLNTALALPTPPAMQNDLGVLGGDLNGFPNGRRPVDDVVDIVLRAAEGALCGAVGNCGTETSDPNKGTAYTDGARAAGPDATHPFVTTNPTSKIKPADTYLDVFPYLNTPIPGSPNGPMGNGE